MPTKKVADIKPKDVCCHPDHDPQKHVVRKPGVYEHICSACGHKIRFTVWAIV